MNTALLIDAIVRQTVVLIASLATAAGYRGQLAHLADQVFSELVRELKRQGLGNKVIADMFGLALRTYQLRVARLSESRTDAGTSLWAAVLNHVQEHAPVLRADVLERFGNDDEATVRSVLRDLIDSGLVARSGRGDATCFMPVPEALETERGPAALDGLVLVAVHRHGPIDADGLCSLVPVGRREVLDEALERLQAQGSVVHEGSLYSARRCVIDYADPSGWEAAVFDHYQAMVAAIVAKLHAGTRRATRSDTVGGSTFVFDLVEDHPMTEEVMGFLETIRQQASDLRQRVLSQASSASPVSAPALRITTYFGQLVQYPGESNDER